MSVKMLAFSGFNGFGQFGSEHGMRTTKFETFSIEGVQRKLKLLISSSWSYNAYAAGKIIILKGFVNGRPNAIVSISANENIKQIDACDRLCLVLLENGKLFKVDPKSAQTLQEIAFANTYVPRKRNIFGEIRSAQRVNISLIASGANITAAVSETNGVYSIPSQIGQLPRHVKVTQLVCGFEHALLLTANGDIYSWGDGLRGQLGAETLKMEEKLTLIDALAGIKITFVAAGGWHSAAISAYGDLYTWGFNSDGQLGLRIFKPDGLREPAVYPLPQLLDLPDCSVCKEKNLSKSENCTPLKVFAGARHTILQMSCKTLLAAGWNKHGQLSLSDESKTEKCDELVKIDMEMDNSCDIRVVCGAWSTIVITGAV